MMKSGNIILRLPEPSDIDQVFSWENDTANWLVSRTHTPYSRATLEQYLSSVHDIYTEKQLRLIVMVNQSVVGCIDVFDVDFKNLNAGLGILISPEFRSKGVGYDALKLVVKYASDILGLKNLQCSILANNEGSKNLFEKAGFKQIGKRNNWIRSENQWLDECLYQLDLHTLS